MYPPGWDERQAAEHNQRPPEGYERISLNPPSGRFYSRLEGIAKHMGIDPEVLKRASANYEGVSDEPSPLPDIPSPEREAESTPLEEADGPSQFPLWIAFTLAALLFALALIRLRRRK